MKTFVTIILAAVALNGCETAARQTKANGLSASIIKTDEYSVTMRIRNGGIAAVRRVDLRLQVHAKGRKTPHVDSVITRTIDGGIEPGETSDTRHHFTEAEFRAIGKIKGKPQFSVTVDDAE